MHPALQEIADRRVEALRTQRRRDIASRLLDECGSVTAEQVDSALAAEWSPPTAKELASQVRDKCAAAVDYATREANAASDAVLRLDGKVAKFAELLERSRVELVEAQDEATAAGTRLSEAGDLLALAAAEANGLPSTSDVGTGDVSPVAATANGVSDGLV